MTQPEQPTVGLINPGAMGTTIAAAARNNSHVIWAGDDRSAASRSRAKEAGLSDVGSLHALVEASEIIISVCPPDAASQVATSVSEAGFDGIYLDANAVSSATARKLGSNFEHFVDGGIVGPPVNESRNTRLYLAGSDAEQVATLFKDSDLEVRIIDGPPGSASAVKMCFAAWTKGTSALLYNIRALAEAEGVTEALLSEWNTSMPQLITRSEESPATVGPKAWRFAGEMTEIADSFSAADLPDGFHRGATDVYDRLSTLKNETDVTLGAVLELLLEERNATP